MLTSFISSVLAPIVGKECALKLSTLNLTAVCVKLFLSKGLGIGIIAGSAVIKVPQIVNIARAKYHHSFQLTDNLYYSFQPMYKLVYNLCTTLTPIDLLQECLTVPISSRL